jgi:sugar phosphate isomerase/epimerase
MAGLWDKTPAEVRKVLDDLGLVASSAHGEFPTPGNLDKIVDAANTLGYKYYVIPWLPPERFATLDDVKATAAVVQATAKMVAAKGLKLGYHNHSHEMVLVEGRAALEIFLEAAKAIAPEIDTYWASNFGAVNVPEFVKKFAKRIELLHIKDGPLVKGQPHAAVGSGKMDIPAVINAADPKVLKWLVVELDSCATDMLTAVRESYAYLTQNGLAQGSK